jgi:hypothetical protein
MQEERITFETAKIAKEKGFDIDTNGFFYPLREETKNIDGLAKVGKLRYSLVDSAGVEFKKDNNYALAPTQSELQKWLREVHGEDVFVIKSVDRYYPVNNSAGLSINDIAHLMKALNWKSYSTYEEALEKVLFETLKQI